MNIFDFKNFIDLINLFHPHPSQKNAEAFRLLIKEGGKGLDPGGRLRAASAMTSALSPARTRSMRMMAPRADRNSNEKMSKE